MVDYILLQCIIIIEHILLLLLLYTLYNLPYNKVGWGTIQIHNEKEFIKYNYLFVTIKDNVFKKKKFL